MNVEIPLTSINPNSRAVSSISTPLSPSRLNKSSGPDNELVGEVLELEDYILKDVQMNDFRKSLRKKILFSAIFVLLMIAERVLYNNLITSEQTALENMQDWLNLNYYIEGTHFTLFNGNFFFRICTFAVGFHTVILIVTQFVATIFVSVNDFIAIKVAFASLIAIYFMGVLELLYDGPLPYWTSEVIASPTCVKTSAHPSLFVFTSLFVSFYFIFCLEAKAAQKIKSKTGTAPSQNFSKFIKSARIGLMIAFPIVFFVVYLSGLAFIINIILSFIFFASFYTIITQADQSVSRIIANVSIDPEQSKRNIFSWFFNIIVLVFAASLVYASSKRFVDISWIGNYLNCTNLQDTFFLNDQLVGPYHTFSVISSLAGLAGLIFGLSYNYNKLNVQCIKTWYKGPAKQRIIRGLIVNVMMAPSWALNYYQGELLRSEFMVNAGLSEFLLDCFHYFLLYITLFGFIPILVFQPLDLVYTKKQPRSFTDRAITFMTK